MAEQCQKCISLSQHDKTKDIDNVCDGHEWHPKQKCLWEFIPQVLRGKNGTGIGTLMPSFTFLGRYITGSLLAGSAAAFDSDKCCVLAARDQLAKFDELPWSVCYYNTSVDYSSGTVYPSVNRTMGWCMENCSGIQLSKVDEWLEPLATWIAPYIGLLLLCPVGEKYSAGKKDPAGEKDPARKKHSMKSKFRSLYYWHKFRFPGDEFINLLGDPVSAISGSIWELAHDTRMVRKLSDSNDSAMIGLVIIANNTRFDDDLEEQLRKKFAESGAAEKPSQHASSRTDNVKRAGESMSREGTDLSKGPPKTSPVSEYSDSKINEAVKIVLIARFPFLNAIALPAILMLAVTAAVFRQAYNKLGDNGTAHSIAFGIWYSWLIFLAVAGNCFATSVNVGLVNMAVKIGVDFKPIVPLRKRYSNAVKWTAWLDSREKKETKANYDVKFYLRYFAGQTLGWFLIAFSSACAATISYTTPTVGFGCRTLTFVLYACLSLIVAWMSVLQHFLDNHVDRRNGKKGITMIATVGKRAYRILAFLNFCVLVVGTALELAGVYRSCRCNSVFASDSFLLELSKNTQQGLDNANDYWLAFGFVAFTAIWILCGIAVGIRAYLMFKLDKHFLKKPDKIQGAKSEEKVGVTSSA